MRPKTKIKLLFLVSVMLITVGFRCSCIKSAEEREATKSVGLTYWTVWNSPTDLSGLISKYQAVHPNIRINVQKLRYEEYEDKILEAYAQLNPPDIISLHYGWMRDYALRKKFISPMPESITMAYQYTEKKFGVKEEVTTELKTSATPSPAKIKEDYLDTVYNDIVLNNKIYGLPLSIDTMVMYYNRDLLNKANIPLPPTNWQDFQSAIKKITTFSDQEKTINTAGSALGTADNIRRSVDILMLLMMQNGAKIIENNNVLLSRPSIDRTYNPGLEALKFYTDFSNPRKEVYTWNAEMPDALEAFSNGKIAFYFGYSFDLPLIRAYSKNSINLGISKMPQIQDSQESYIANYWVETVSSRTENPNEAWDFILFMNRPENVSEYLTTAIRPTALRSLVEAQIQNDTLNIFASQLLNSKTWYTGYNVNAAEEYVKEMINRVLDGENPAQSLNLAASRIQQTLLP